MFLGNSGREMTVILVRTVGGSLADRVGGRRTLALAAPTAAGGLLMSAYLPTSAALLGVAVLGVGQALAVPAFGLLAIRSVTAQQQGLASGVFFSWFDAGVGTGAPFAGAAASVTDPSGALVAAALAVSLAPVAARLRPPRLVSTSSRAGNRRSMSSTT
jgi:MFS family permease